MLLEPVIPWLRHDILHVAIDGSLVLLSGEYKVATGNHVDGRAPKTTLGVLPIWS